MCGQNEPLSQPTRNTTQPMLNICHQNMMDGGRSVVTEGWLWPDYPGSDPVSLASRQLRHGREDGINIDLNMDAGA